MSRVPSFCHGWSVTTSSTRSSASSWRTLTAVTRWPTWGGSNVPPKMPEPLAHQAPARRRRPQSASHPRRPARPGPGDGGHRPRRPARPAPATGPLGQPGQRRDAPLADGRQRLVGPGRPAGPPPSPAASSGRPSRPSSCRPDDVAVGAAARPACGPGSVTLPVGQLHLGPVARPRPACRPRPARGVGAGAELGADAEGVDRRPGGEQVGDAVLVEVAGGEDRHVGRARLVEDGRTSRTGRARSPESRRTAGDARCPRPPAPGPPRPPARAPRTVS